MNNKNQFLPVFLVVFLFATCAYQSFSQVTSRSSRKSSAPQDDQYLEAIKNVYYYVQQNYVEEVDPKVLYEGALEGMLNALGDPYSSYLDATDWRSITDTTTGSFGGVGLSISKANVSTPEKPAYVEVVTPIDDTPGAKAGIQAGDYIIEIDGTDTSTITMEEVLSILRGPAGTDVTVKILRGKNMIFERTMTRAIITNPTVKYGMINSTGYIRISEFSTSTTDDVQQAIDSFKQSGYDSLIIDLRNNGGGLLSTAVNLADKFIDRGVLVATKSRIPHENYIWYAHRQNTVVKNVPIIVLINSGSASASEILSGALKDSKTAYLVGERTYGKGSVQIPEELLNNDGFKITVARYYTPSDVNIDKVGIPADLEVLYPELSDEEAQAYLDLLDTDIIETYVEQHPDMTENDIASYAVELQKTYKLELRFLRKLIRNEVDRTKPSRLYDLDYDIQLNAALDVLSSGDFWTLLQNTKTLKEIQDEAE